MGREEPLTFLGFWLVGLLAQSQRPLSAEGPQVQAPVRPRVSVVAHEGLDPDRLRDLARPGVTLWLRTDSNLLRDSTLERLALFDEAWVSLRPPLLARDRRPLERLPRVGAWLSVPALPVVGQLPASARVALEVEGALPAPSVLRRARLAWLRWAPQAPLDVLAWAEFAQAPGRHVLVTGPATLLATRCEARDPRGPQAELDLSTLLSLNADAFPCGPGARVRLRPDVEPWVLQSLLVRDSGLELVFEVRDEASAIAVSRLFDRLGLVPRR